MSLPMHATGGHVVCTSASADEGAPEAGSRGGAEQIAAVHHEQGGQKLGSAGAHRGGADPRDRNG